MRNCKKCLNNKQIEEFPLNSKGYRRHTCFYCWKLNYKQWCAKNSDKFTSYAEKYKDKAKIRRELNKEKISEYHKKYQKERYEKDIEFRLRKRLRNRLYLAIKENKAGSAIKDLGCSIKELKIYLESKWTEGMSWDNYGQWEIDHIVALCLFSLNNREQFLAAAHYTNLQPIWKQDHVVKSKEDLRKAGY